jgi:hypothetical protein
LCAEVATPLGAEYYIGGMTDEEQSFVAEVMPNMEAKLFAAKDGPDQTSLGALGVAMGYQRVNHDAHWFSDTVAGAAIGIATAKFVMRRREGTEPRGQLLLLPTDGGVRVTYAVPLR